MGDDRKRAEMTGPQGGFDRWMNEYGRAYQNPSGVGSQPCPNCGAVSLRLIFIVEALGSERGMAVFWCDSCLHGLIPLSAPVATGGERVQKGSEHVPNYTLVIDE